MKSVKAIKQFVTYILECADGTLYLGSTDNLERRLHEHNNLKSGAHYTKIRRPVVLRYRETFTNLKDARTRERALKKLTRTKKIDLIHSI